MTHSGRFLLRIPRTLHAELARQAAEEGVSLNQYASTLLAGASGWRRAISERRIVEAAELSQALTTIASSQ